MLQGRRICRQHIIMKGFAVLSSRLNIIQKRFLMMYIFSRPQHRNVEAAEMSCLTVG